MPIDHSQMKLGRLPAKFDKRIPEFSRYLTAKLPMSPPACDWSSKLEDWKMLANDRLGDCTAAGCAHAIMAWTQNASTLANITDNDTVSFYERSAGYDPQDSDSDRGAVELDVLNYWHRNDFAGHKLDAFASLDIGNRANIKDAIWLCGGIYIGINLPLSARDQEIWDVPSGGLKGDGAPSSWGGHAVQCIAFTNQYIVCVTWGQLKTMTWEFWNAYVEEAWALVSRDWLKSNGVSPSGFKYDELIADMAALGDTSPMGKLQEAIEDPVLADLTWGDVTISLHEAAATWALGIIATALAAYGQFDSNSYTTWLGAAGALYATWRNLARVHGMNMKTQDLVTAAAEVIDILMRSKRTH